MREVYVVVFGNNKWSFLGVEDETGEYFQETSISRVFSTEESAKRHVKKLEETKDYDIIEIEVHKVAE